MFGIVLMNIKFSAQWSQFWLIIVSVSHCVKQQQQHLIYAQLVDVCCESNLYSQHALDLIPSNTQNILATT